MQMLLVLGRCAGLVDMVCTGHNADVVSAGKVRWLGGYGVCADEKRTRKWTAGENLVLLLRDMTSVLHVVSRALCY